MLGSRGRGGIRLPACSSAGLQGASAAAAAYHLLPSLPSRRADNGEDAAAAAAGLGNHWAEGNGDAYAGLDAHLSYAEVAAAPAAAFRGRGEAAPAAEQEAAEAAAEPPQSPFRAAAPPAAERAGGACGDGSKPGSPAAAGEAEAEAAEAGPDSLEDELVRLQPQTFAAQPRGRQALRGAGAAQGLPQDVGAEHVNITQYPPACARILLPPPLPRPR